MHMISHGVYDCREFWKEECYKSAESFAFYKARCYWPCARTVGISV